MAQSEQMEEHIATSANHGVRKRPRPVDRETVDGFHQRVTSEDNAEFEMNMVREARIKRDKMDIVYGATGSEFKNVQQKLLEYDRCGSLSEMRKKDRSNPADDAKKQICDTPLMASDEFNPPVQRIQAAGTTTEGKNKNDRNSLFFTPTFDGESEILQKSTNANVTKSTSSSLEDVQTDQNHISMPPPSNRISSKAIVHSSPSSSQQITSQGPAAQKMHRVEYQAKPTLTPAHGSHSNEKQIIPSNTRFSYQNESRLVALSADRNRTLEPHSTVASSTSMSMGQTKHYETDSSACTTDLDASPLPLNIERRQRQTMIERERNTFVTMTPIIVPGGGDGDGDGCGDRDDDSPIITWGNVASTPLVTGGHDEPNHAELRLPAVDQTETVAKAAELKVTKQIKRLKHADQMQKVNKDDTTKNSVLSKSSSTSRHSSSSAYSNVDRVSSFTPAARSLLEWSTPNRGRVGGSFLRN